MIINIPEDLGLKPLPEGIYDATITSVQLKQSSTGKDMLQVEFTVTSGDHIGRKLFESYTCDDKVYWRHNLLFRACTGKDIPAGSYSIDEYLNLFTSSCLNKPVVIRVEADVYEGQERNRVREVRKPNL